MNQITPQELKARLDRRDAIVLLNVRQDWETKLCSSTSGPGPS